MAGIKDFLKLPQPIQQTLVTAGYTAGGMLANRFISARLADAFKIQNADLLVGLRAASGIGIGMLAFQVMKDKKIATAMTAGALADVLLGLWNRFAPEGFQFAGDNLGLIYSERPGLERQLPESAFSGASQFSGNGMGLQLLEVPQMG